MIAQAVNSEMDSIFRATLEKQIEKWKTTRRLTLLGFALVINYATVKITFTNETPNHCK